MLSKVHSDGGPIAFFDCRVCGEFFHWFSNFNHVFPSKPTLFLKSSLLHFQKRCLVCLIYFRLNLIPEVIIQRVAVWWFWRPLIFFDVTSRYGFFPKIWNEITGMGRCTILNENPIFSWIDLINGRK